MIRENGFLIILDVFQRILAYTCITKKVQLWKNKIGWELHFHVNLGAITASFPFNKNSIRVHENAKKFVSGPIESPELPVDHADQAKPVQPPKQTQNTGTGIL